MPVEYALLKDQPELLSTCPICGETPFRSFLRGQVQRWGYPWWDPLGFFSGKRPYCAVVCSSCKFIVDYELPPQGVVG